jgi:hypothetical protein
MTTHRSASKPALDGGGVTRGQVFDLCAGHPGEGPGEGSASTSTRVGPYPGMRLHCSLRTDQDLSLVLGRGSPLVTPHYA